MLKKALINCFLLGWLMVIAIDPAPNIGGWHRILQDKLDPYLAVTGLWQGGWPLFAPDPDKINVGIKAEIAYSDGTTAVWRSPDWRSLLAWQRYLQYRESGFIDYVRRDGYSDAWAPFADYLMREISHPDNPNLKPTKIALTREWVFVPPPNSLTLSQFPKTPVKDQSCIFFEKEYQP